MSRVAIVAVVALIACAAASGSGSGSAPAPDTNSNSSASGSSSGTEVPVTAVPEMQEGNCTFSNTGPDGNETATMQYFGMNSNQTVKSGTEDLTFDIKPCDGDNTFPGCPSAQTGYIARYTDAGMCETVFNVKGDTTWNNVNQSFDTVYTSTYGNSFFEDSITLRLICAQGSDEDIGRLSNGVLIFHSESVCPGYVPTPAPNSGSTSGSGSTTPSKGLSIGAIVGIVIGALAVLVIVLVIFRWKSQKGEEEGEYQRV